MDTGASARKHDAPDEDMLHAYRRQWRAFVTDDATVAMFIGPARGGSPIEVAVVADDDGEALIHCMPARAKFLKGWWTP